MLILSTAARVGDVGTVVIGRRYQKYQDKAYALPYLFILKGVFV